MKTYLAAFLLFVLVTPLCAGENGSKTTDEWIAVITSDAKLSSLKTTLGKPDLEKIVDQSDLGGKPDTVCVWNGKLDVGTSTPIKLAISAKQYAGVWIICQIMDPRDIDATYSFPWADKVEHGAQAKNEHPQIISQTEGWTEKQLQATLTDRDIIHGDGVPGHTVQGGYGESLIEARRKALREISIGTRGRKVVILSENSHVIYKDKNGKYQYSYQIVFETSR